MYFDIDAFESLELSFFSKFDDYLNDYFLGNFCTSHEIFDKLWLLELSESTLPLLLYGRGVAFS